MISRELINQFSRSSEFGFVLELGASEVEDMGSLLHKKCIAGFSRLIFLDFLTLTFDSSSQSTIRE